MKPNSTVLFLVAAVMLSWNGSSPPAFGQATDQKPQELFKKLDTNKDSKLTADEIGKDRRRFFDRLVRTGDKNKDGELNQEEFLNALKQEDRPATHSADSREPNRKRPTGNRVFNPKQTFNRLDRNQDGKLSLNEIPEPMRPRMKPLFEKRKKEEISLEEFAKFLRGAPTAGGRPQVRENYFKQLDKNNDGKLALDEIPQRAQGRLKPVFERLGKKVLTQEEFAKAMAGRFRTTDGKGRPEANRRPEGNRERESARDGDRRPGARDRDRRPGDGDRNQDRDRNRGRGDRGPGGSGGPAFFRLLDENRDGQLSKNELAKASEKLMELDRNKDGRLDPRELFGGGPQGFRGGPQGFRGPFGPRSGFRPPFERRGDDSRPDFRAPFRRPGDGPPPDARRSERRPDEASRERRRPDGSVQRSRGNSNRSRAGDAQRSRSRGRGSEGEAGRGPGSPGFAEGLLKRLDKNSDGKLSKSESSERLLEGFSRFDGNKDGSLDLEELKRAFSRRGGRDAPRERPERNREKKEGE